MDIIIAYVDGQDPVWQKDYEVYMNAPVLAKRFRDWGTLPYLFRGIQYRMPFIENVFLVVSHESQVPEWVDRDNVKVVLHKDYIPQEYLPTFNSTTISLFLHRIPGLGEQYLYFNDDIFPVGECRPEDYFRNGKVVNSRISCKHVSMATVTPSSIGSYVLAPSGSFVCINDVNMTEEKYMEFRKALLDAFEEKFPHKSRFEK